MLVELIDTSRVTIKYDRIREDVGDIEAMANSMTKFGQLQPIIVDEDYALVDGFRRLTTCIKMGRQVLVVRESNVDELMSRELELEANLLRKDMTWQERVKGLSELDRIKRERDPNWTQPQTAAVAGMHQRDISQAVTLSKLIEVMPELKDAKSINQAMNMAKNKVTMNVRKKEVSDAPEIYASIEERIILGDSVEIIKRVPDSSFHAIITDPPFGVDYDSRVAGTVGEANSYVDDRESYLRILSIAPDMYRVLKPNGWLVFFLGISWYEQAKETFRAAGFTVDEIPIIWKRDQGRTFTNRPDRYFTRGYDIALHAFRGEPRMVIPGRSNILDIPPVASADRNLLVERPVELYGELIDRLTVPGEIVADFFVGSGSCPAAAASKKRGYFGVELDSGRRASAIQKIRAYTPDQ